MPHEDAGPDAFDLMWNRACGFDDPALSTHPGDEALHVALVFEGRVENAGLCEALGNHAEDTEYPLDRVRTAFAQLGLTEVATTIARAHQELAGSVRDEGLLPRGVEERIDAMWPVAGVGLEQAARALLGRCPELFAPVS